MTGKIMMGMIVAARFDAVEACGANRPVATSGADRPIAAGGAFSARGPCDSTNR